MSIRDSWIFAREITRALSAVGLDAIREPLGRALPSGPGPLCDPASFAQWIEAGRTRASAAPWHPTSVTLSDHVAPSSNCRNSVLEIDWGAEAESRPRSVFVKQPSDDLATRVFAGVIGFWKIECTVCRNLADALPIDSPRIYSVVERGSRFLLVMENLLERPDTRMFVNRQLLDGADLDTARRCLTTLATLHAGFASWSPQQRERALPLALHPFRSPSLEPIMLAVNRLAVSPCRDRAPELFDEASAALYRRALARWRTLERAWYREPLTLVHGDSHLGNHFVSGEGMGMIDFQGAHWGQGARDVQYFLVNSMQSEALEKVERELVAHYADELTRLGAALDPETAWDQYRGFSFQTLMTAVVSLGLGSFSDSDAVMRAMLERSVAATRRLEFEAWMEAL